MLDTQKNPNPGGVLAADQAAVDEGMLGLDGREEVLLWMSLALDGLLDAEDDARLQQALAEDAALRETWRAWQKVDVVLAETPPAAPAPGFVERFAVKLEARERRARRRRQVLFASAAVAAWFGVAAVIVLLGWTLLANQTQWMNDFVRELVFYPSAVAIWLRAVRTSLSAFISEPESLAMGLCTAVGVGLLLYGWLVVLRRTTRMEVVSS